MGETAVLMTKQRTVYRRVPDTIAPLDRGDVQFQSDPGQEGNKVFLLPAKDWHEFGQPDSITVTVEPGDHLN